MINLLSVNRVVNLMRQDVDVYDPEGNVLESSQVSSLIILKVYENNKDFNFKRKDEYKKHFKSDYKKSDNTDDNININEIICKKMHLINRNPADLNRDCWVIVPVYPDMDGLYPLYSVTNKKSNSITLHMFDEPLFSIDKSIFSSETRDKWRWNNSYTIRDLCQQNGGAYTFAGLENFGYFSSDTKLIKILANEYLLNQKNRIKAGNSCINALEEAMGNSKYRKMKLEMGFKNRLFTKEEYETLSDKELMKFVDNGRTYTITNEEGKEEVIKGKPITIIDELYKAAKDIQTRISTLGKRINCQEKFVEYGLDDTIIKDYNMYMIISSIYAKKLDIEEQTLSILKDAVSNHILYQRYFKNIYGIAEKSAAFFIAYLDPTKAIHPSGFLKYCGLDNITIKNETENLDNIIPASSVLEYDYNVISTRIKNNNCICGDINSMDDYTFFTNFATDTIDTVDKYLAVKAWKDTDHHFGEEIEYESLDLYPEFFELLKETTKFNFGINKNGYTVIHKRARNKSDKVVTTYITKEGKISTKNSLGYNSELKGLIIGHLIMASIMKHNENKSYYKAIINKYKERLQAKAKLLGKEDKLINRKAIRYCAQEILKDFWLAAREIYGLPLNGGTYEEGRLGYLHGATNCVVPRPTVIKNEQLELDLL